jgi:hypothetical protein
MNHLQIPGAAKRRKDKSSQDNMVREDVEQSSLSTSHIQGQGGNHFQHQAPSPAYYMHN